MKEKGSMYRYRMRQWGVLVQTAAAAAAAVHRSRGNGGRREDDETNDCTKGWCEQRKRRRKQPRGNFSAGGMLNQHHRNNLLLLVTKPRPHSIRLTRARNPPNGATTFPACSTRQVGLRKRRHVDTTPRICLGRVTKTHNPRVMRLPHG